MAMEVSRGFVWFLVMGARGSCCDAAVPQLCQVGGPVLGRMSSVREHSLAVAVGVEHCWCNRVEVFQHTLGCAASYSCEVTMVILFGGVWRRSVW